MKNISAEQVAALREAAEEIVHPDDSKSSFDDIRGDREGCPVYRGQMTVATAYTPKRAAFISQATPSMILQLLNEIDRLEALTDVQLKQLHMYRS